jgi:hypothetical protein
LKPGRSIASDVKRIVDKQLTLAGDDLRAIGDRCSDDAIHEARRHVKKVRAILRLVQPALGEAYSGANRRMRTANRMLAPIADGRAVVDTIGRLRKQYGTTLTRRTLTATRAVLDERAARIDRKADLDRVLPKVAAILRRERRRVAAWTLNARGFRAIGPGLEESIRGARHAMAQARRHPTAENYHVWRRRVKDLWFHVRLVDARCGGALTVDEHRLEALDGCLGEYHNVVLLEHILMSEALVSRQQTTRGLHLLRRYQTELRQMALALAHRCLHEKPRRFVRRVEGLWQSAKNARGPEAKTPWPHAA